MRTAEIENLLSQKIGARDMLRSQLKAGTEKLGPLAARIEAVEEAQKIIQIVAQETQKGLVFHISDIVTTALEAVFGADAYEFKIEFVQRRGKTEADLYFIRNGEKIDPLTASGGGAIDVSSFALRVALWSVIKSTGKPISNTIIIDEPMKWLSSDLQDKAGEMLKMLSEKLGIQFIMVTHIQELIEASDRVFEVKLHKQISKVEVVK